MANLDAYSAAREGDRVQVSLTGDTGSATSPIYTGDAGFALDESELLSAWRLDPEAWEIIDGSLTVNRWVQNAAEDLWAFQYKARVQRRTVSIELADVPPLVQVTAKVRTVKAKRVATDLACAVIFPDAQISYWLGDDEQWHTTHDEAAIDISRQVLADVESEHGVDVVVDLGDFLDATHFSRHRSAPAQIDRLGFRKAVARGQEELAVRTALTPNASARWLIPGNHENRIILWMVDNAPWLMGLTPTGTDPVLSLEWLLQTGEHCWQVADAYPEGVVWLNDNTRCIHGHVAKGVPGASSAEYLKDECNTFFGHTPRAQTVYRTTARHGHSRTYVATTAGGLMRVDGAVPSASTGTKVTGDPVLARGEKWDQGFSVVFYDPEGTTVPFVETVSIFGGRAVWRGRIYEASVDVDGNPL